VRCPPPPKSSSHIYNWKSTIRIPNTARYEPDKVEPIRAALGAPVRAPNKNIQALHIQTWPPCHRTCHVITVGRRTDSGRDSTLDIRLAGVDDTKERGKLPTKEEERKAPLVQWSTEQYWTVLCRVPGTVWTVPEGCEEPTGTGQHGGTARIVPARGTVQDSSRNEKKNWPELYPLLKTNRKRNWPGQTSGRICP
jgi:hypothetical protein